jgi:hypothetical protein
MFNSQSRNSGVFTYMNPNAVSTRTTVAISFHSSCCLAAFAASSAYQSATWAWSTASMDA